MLAQFDLCLNDSIVAVTAFVISAKTIALARLGQIGPRHFATLAGIVILSVDLECQDGTLVGTHISAVGDVGAIEIVFVEQFGIEHLLNLEEMAARGIQCEVSTVILDIQTSTERVHILVLQAALAHKQCVR